jgi:hypothetical protein
LFDPLKIHILEIGTDDKPINVVVRKTGELNATAFTKIVRCNGADETSSQSQDQKIPRGCRHDEWISILEVLQHKHYSSQNKYSMSFSFKNTVAID